MAKSALQAELFDFGSFADFNFDRKLTSLAGCAKPIGRRGYWKPPRAGKRVAALNGMREELAAMVGILRGVMVEFDTLARRTEQDSEKVDLLLRKVTDLQRAAGLVETAPLRHTRRRPLG